MKLKKFLALMLCLCLTLALCACGGKTKNDPSANQPGTTNTQQEDQNGQNGAGTVDFGLQTAPDPDFDSPATGDDSGKLYTIVGDYAYELDPSTLQPIGPPLDPVTHQPVENPVLEGENPSTPNNPQTTQATQPADPEPEPEQEPEPETKPDTELPNTGMFLEDD